MAGYISLLIFSELRNRRFSDDSRESRSKLALICAILEAKFRGDPQTSQQFSLSY